MNFIIEQLCSRHVIFILGAFLLGTLFLFFTLSFLLLCFLSFLSLEALFLVDVELVVGHVEAHFAENVAISDFVRAKTMKG